ncbi:substrate-binding periplasmic protein [Burkholderiaceae bacterium UC74_6]
MLIALSIALHGNCCHGADQPAAPVALPASITVCDDDAERPPFVYYQRQFGVKTEKVTGFAVEVLRQILASRNMTFTVELLPWRRCLNSVQEGRVDMVLSVTKNPEREKQLLFSTALYVTRLVYFFDGERPPPQVLTRDDLLKYKICLVSGMNYSQFGLPPNSPNVAGAAKSLGQAFLMLKSKRCEIVPARLEGAIGYRLIGLADYEQIGLSVAAMPDRANATQSLHFAVSVRHAQAQALVQLLNDGLEHLKVTGEISNLSDRFGLARQH